MVKSSADSLLKVINDILDFSKIEAGKIELDVSDFLLRDSVGDTMKALAVRAAEKGPGAGVRHSAERAGRLGGRRRPAAASAGQPGGQRHQVHRTGRGNHTCRHRGAIRWRGAAPLQYQRHRHRRTGGQAKSHFQALRAGRRLYHPALRRHGPGPRHLDATGGADGRTDLGRERGRPRQHLPLHCALWTFEPAGQAPDSGGAALAARAAGVDRGRQRHQPSHPLRDPHQLAHAGDHGGRRHRRAHRTNAGGRARATVPVGAARRADAAHGWIRAGGADQAALRSYPGQRL